MDNAIVTARNREYPPTDICCWEYYLRNTAQYGEYNVFKHGNLDHPKSEFVCHVEALASFFSREMGLTERDVFTVFMPTNAESMMIFMALNKLGVIVNFVHPLLPPEMVEDIMEDTGSKGIALLDMIAPKYAAVIRKRGIPAILCNPKEYAYPSLDMAQIDETALRVMAEPFFCYPDIIRKYSGHRVDSVDEGLGLIASYMNGGGTTGKSKTIKLSNLAFNYVVYMLAGVNVPCADVGVDTELCTMPFFHAFGFCAGGLSAMNKGSKVIFISKFEPETFVKLMKENHVTEFNGVPNMYKKLLACPGFDDPALGNIQVMYSGGDFVSPQLLEAIHAVMRKNGSNAEFCAGYGLTECCAVCSVNPPWANKNGTIGKPLDWLRFEIWNEKNEPVPAGEIGQIVMTGPTMMEGYLTKNGPVDSGIYKDRFGTKWVFSGDLGKMDEDGYVTFVGRQKRVIIISGYNVYPVDIEMLTDVFDFVRESCAVQGYLDGKPIVRLFVVLAQDGDKDEYARIITDKIKDNLSAFSVPKEIRFIDELPRTRLQKVDFMALSQFSPEE